MDSSRRRFIKGALVGGIAVSTSGGLTRMVTGLTGVDALNLYTKGFGVGVDMPYPDDLHQERIMKGKKYVMMTDEEKKEMIEFFTNNYNKQE